MVKTSRSCFFISRRAKRDSSEQSEPVEMESPDKENKPEVPEDEEVPDSPTKSDNYFSRKFGSLLNRSKRKFKKQDSHDSAISQNGEGSDKSPVSPKKHGKHFFKRTKSQKSQDSLDESAKHAPMTAEHPVDNGDLESLENQEDRSKRRMSHTKYSEQRQVLVQGKALREVEVTGEKPGEDVTDRRKQRKLAKRKSMEGDDLNVSCRQLGAADFEGWMHKKSGGTGLTPVTWKKSWCVLKNGTLYLFKTSFDQVALSIYHLKNYTLIHVPEEKRKCSFKIQPKNVAKEALADAKAIVFATENEAEVDKWTDVLQKASQGVAVSSTKENQEVLTSDRRRCYTTGTKLNRGKDKQNGAQQPKSWRPQSSSFTGEETTGMPSRSGSTSNRPRKISNTTSPGASVLAVGSMFRPIDNPDEVKRLPLTLPGEEVDKHHHKEPVPASTEEIPAEVVSEDKKTISIEEKLPDVVESTLDAKEKDLMEANARRLEEEAELQRTLDVRKEIERLENQARMPEPARPKSDGEHGEDYVPTEFVERLEDEQRVEDLQTRDDTQGEYRGSEVVAPTVEQEIRESVPDDGVVRKTSVEREVKDVSEVEPEPPVDNINVLVATPVVSPVVEEAKADGPRTEEPKTEELKTEELKTEEPKTEEPKTEEPKTEEPKTEELKTEEPKKEELKTEEPITEESKTEEPEPEISKTEEPVVEDSRTAEPKTEDLPVEESKTDEPETEEPQTEEKSSKEGEGVTEVSQGARIEDVEETTEVTTEDRVVKDSEPEVVSEQIEEEVIETREVESTVDAVKSEEPAPSDKSTSVGESEDQANVEEEIDTSADLRVTEVEPSREREAEGSEVQADESTDSTETCENTEETKESTEADSQQVKAEVTIIVEEVGSSVQEEVKESTESNQQEKEVVSEADQAVSVNVEEAEGQSEAAKETSEMGAAAPVEPAKEDESSPTAPTTTESAQEPAAEETQGSTEEVQTKVEVVVVMEEEKRVEADTEVQESVPAADVTDSTTLEPNVVSENKEEEERTTEETPSQEEVKVDETAEKVSVEAKVSSETEENNNNITKEPETGPSKDETIEVPEVQIKNDTVISIEITQPLEADAVDKVTEDSNDNVATIESANNT